jgi:hypothetical protein
MLQCATEEACVLASPKTSREEDTRRTLIHLTKDLQHKQGKMASKLQDIQSTQEEKLKAIEEKIAQQQKFNDQLLALLKDSC